MVNDNSLSDSILIQIGVLEKDIKGLKDTLYSLEHSGESGRGYDRQIANIKNQIQQKTKQIQQFKRSINMNDTMAQLAMIGITQDAEGIPNEKIMEILRLRYNKVSSPEKTEQDLLKAGVKPDVAKRLSKNPGMFTKSDFKDDDATEHGSIETYGKEKETETMPLEKDPVQAQDAYTPGSYDPKRHEVNLWKLDNEIERWRRTVSTLKQQIAGLERMVSSGEYSKLTNEELKRAKRDQEAAYMRLKQALSMKQRATGQKDEEPTDVKDANPGEHVKVKNHGTGELVDLKVLKDNGDGTLEVKAPTGAVITIKESWIVKDEEPTTDADPIKEREDSLKQAEAELERAKKTLASNPGNSFFKELVIGAERGVRFAKENLERAKRNSTHDEEPNHVQDSYDMLKLCGIIS